MGIKLLAHFPSDLWTLLFYCLTKFAVRSETLIFFLSLYMTWFLCSDPHDYLKFIRIFFLLLLFIISWNFLFEFLKLWFVNFWSGLSIMHIQGFLFYHLYSYYYFPFISPRLLSQCLLFIFCFLRFHFYRFSNLIFFHILPSLFSIFYSLWTCMLAFKKKITLPCRFWICGELVIKFLEGVTRCDHSFLINAYLNLGQ